MAKLLNGTRVRDTRIILLLCVLTTIVTRPAFNPGSPLLELCDMVGEWLVALCAVGRIYSTAFLGGYKNETLITAGPFSVCRNPLYFCSFLGTVGIAFMSKHLVLLLVVPALFLLVYHRLIRREESTLYALFGVDYGRYVASTPRFWPRLAGYSVPGSLTINPRLLANAVLDGLLWFLALPLFNLIEYAQRLGIFPGRWLLY